MKLLKQNILTAAVSILVSVAFVGLAAEAATTISTNIVTAGTLSVTGLSTLSGGATTTSITLLNGETVSNATDGTITFGASNTVLAGTASSSAILVGTDNNNTVSGIMFGSCAIAATSFTSTSTYTTCTGATGVSSSYKVFTQATSSMPAGVHVAAASTTSTTGTISIRLDMMAAPASLTAGQVYLNYWAVR